MSEKKGKEVESSQAKPVSYVTKKQMRQLGTMMGVLQAEFEFYAGLTATRHGFYEALLKPYLKTDDDGNQYVDLDGASYKDKRLLLHAFHQLENTAMKHAGNDDNAKAAHSLAEQLRQLNAERRGESGE